MSLAVIERALKDFPKEYRVREFADTTSPQLKGIFKKIWQYLKPGQEIVFYLVDIIDPDRETYKHVLTKEKVTIYSTKTAKKLETYPWERYLKLLPLFPSEVKIAVEELKKLKENNNPLWQLIK